jgi:hypothetical protein
MKKINRKRLFLYSALVLAWFCLSLSNANNAFADEYILDNSAPGTSYTGSWQVSGTAGYYALILSTDVTVLPIPGMSICPSQVFMKFICGGPSIHPVQPVRR